MSSKSQSIETKPYLDFDIEIEKSIKNKVTPEQINVTHSKLEDFIAMLIATMIISFALVLLQSSNTMTGGTAGLALLVHYTTNIKFSVLFFLFNLPFYYLAYKRLGMDMVIKTLIAVSLLSAMTELHAMFFDVTQIQPVYGTTLAGVLMGVGFVILFRHRASLGGVNLLALYVQEHYKIPAGKIQMVLDVCILSGSFAFIDWRLAVISIVGVIVFNMILTMNHRDDRYIGNKLD